jgi:hypothetical protein
MTSSIITKTLIPLFLLCLIGLCTYGQKTELNFNAYTAFFGFHGNGTTTTSYINSNEMANPVDSTFNVYGKNGSFSYSLELQGQRITKHKLIYGLGIAFEQLNSKVSIDSVRKIIFGKQYALSGKTSLKNSYLTLNPFLGRRFMINKITLDFLFGVDIAFCEKSEEDSKTKFVDNPRGDPAIFKNTKTKPSVDYRPRVQMKAEYKKIGLLLGYSLGLTDYKQQSSTEAYSNLLRLGISYRLK